MSGEELIGEIREVLKALLSRGAKLPKHLMLYVKNMIFIDGAIVRLAPDIDLFAEVGKIYGYFAMRHGARIMSDIGFDAAANAFDPTTLRAQLGLEDGVDTLSHRELRERRTVIQKRVEESGGLPVVDEK